ncbi:MAG: Nramp family divalent metal transporter [Bacteroidales bacterium]|nr:Nramp family divalent metal transporter [Bacteroidales bacterium]
MTFRNLLKILGPGLLYAGAAVGVSHLVQSTRAGASYGFELLWVLILANVIKYPFFEFGPRYAAATGKNLIDGYRETGKWAVVMFALLTLGTMFAIQAAVTIVTAGLVGNVFNLSMSAVQISGIILVVTMLILMIGRYQVLDNLMKFVIVLLAVSTLVAVIFSLDKSTPVQASHFNWADHLDIAFLIAFIGWMPAPLDVTVWQSLWTNAKYESKDRPRLKDVLLDFNIGYIGTIFLAIGFLSLGALILAGSEEELSSKGAVFAHQLISMYTNSIGDWAYYIIAIAAVTTMFSTTITVLDAYPRVLKPLTLMAFPKMKNRTSGFDKQSWFWIIVVVSGALIFVNFLGKTMITMVDIATTISFVTAPLLAYLNYRVVTGKSMPEEAKPKLWLKIFAWTGIIFLSGFTLFYIIWLM